MLFQRDGQCSGEPIALHLPGQQQCRILITDLKLGTWKATRSGGESINVQVTRESSAAWLQGRAGHWRIEKTAGAKVPRKGTANTR